MHKWREYDSMCFSLTCPHVSEIYSYAWKYSIITWFQRKNPRQINAGKIIFVSTMCWFRRKYMKHRFLRNFSNTIKSIFDWQFNDVKLFELHFVLWIEWNELWHLCFFTLSDVICGKNTSFNDILRSAFSKRTNTSIKWKNTSSFEMLLPIGIRIYPFFTLNFAFLCIWREYLS